MNPPSSITAGTQPATAPLETPLDIADQLLEQADEFLKKNELELALRAAQEALEIQEKCCGCDHFVVANTLVFLGTIYLKLEKCAQAHDLAVRALAIQEMHYGCDHIVVANTYLFLGEVHLQLGQYDYARALAERALAIQEAYYGIGHSSLGRTHELLGRIYHHLGNWEKALEELQKTLRLYEAHFPGDHPLLGDIRNQIALIEKEIAVDKVATSRLETTRSLESVLQRYRTKTEPHLPTAETALRRASACGSVEDISVLLNRGAEIDAQDSNKTKLRTALHWAILKGEVQAAEVLIHSGARWDIPDAEGRSATDLIRESESEELQLLLHALRLTCS